MTLTSPQIATLTALIHANRSDSAWDKQGILKHVETLAADPRPFDQLEAQAIAASANPKATTPAAILWTATPRTPDQPNAGWSTRPGPECPEHHNPNWRTSAGEWSCCYFERLLEASEQERFGGRPDLETTEGAARG